MHTKPMEFITQNDLDLIRSCSGKDIDEENFGRLKAIYGKLKHICGQLESKGFVCNLRQDPRKQAGPGRFVFKEYHWAKVYPASFFTAANDKFAYIIGFSDTVHFHLKGIADYQNHPASEKASETCWTDLDIEDSSYEQIVDEFVEFDKQYRNLFIHTGADLAIQEFVKIKKNMEQQDIMQLLKYKGQIILQGPPGTGKTKRAIELADSLLNNTIAIDKAYIRKVCEQLAKSHRNIDNTTINTIDGDQLACTRGKQYETFSLSLNQLYNCYITRDFAKTDYVPYSHYATRIIVKYILNVYRAEEKADQLKIVQFHPGYTYEDFVRGITVKPNAGSEGLVYEADNKVLGKLAAEAWDNYNATRGVAETSVSEDWLEQMFEEFKELIATELIEKDHKIALTNKLNLTEIRKDAFRIASDTWKGDNLKFAEIRKLYKYGIQSKEETKKYPDIARTVYHRTPYYFPVVEKFKAFLAGKPTPKKESVQLKNYVLIIDEINRANLSSVLGELIYALEYRNRPVESMYAVDDDNRLVLPSNLYIIGTMNTADRSVGHIDYAIRRRFGFVEVLPEDLSDDPNITFDAVLFHQVKELFTTDDYKTRSAYLSLEFEPKDVALGHSYFIDRSEDGGSMDIRLEHEIKPILFEYIKDGVLQGEGIREKIDQLTANIF
jgi:hypothetical protein